MLSARRLIYFIVLFAFFLLIPKRVEASSTVFYPHTNHQGSVVMVTDESGEVVEGERYYAYGEDRLESSSQNITSGSVEPLARKELSDHISTGQC